MSANDKKPKLPCFIEVASLNDFARLTCALERVALPIFRFRVKGEDILAAQLDLFKGTPILYYVKSRDTGSFIGYGSAAGKEVVELSTATREAKNAYAPIISVEKIPKMFAKGFGEKEKKIDKYIGMQVEDLTDICKVAFYKIAFEEPPLPFFTFPVDNEWVLGVFARLDEADEVAVFFHINLKNRPEHGFTKYSSVNPEKTELTDLIDGHGYVYGKIIRLTEAHPMVDI